MIKKKMYKKFILGIYFILFIALPLPIKNVLLYNIMKFKL